MSPRERARRLGRRLDVTRALGSGWKLVTRFGTIGLLAFVVDVGTFNVLRQVVELGPLTSKTIAVVLATTVAFAGNRSWTFAERGQGHGVSRAYVLFFAFNGVALLISLACLAFSSYVLGLTSPLAENISTNVIGLGLGTLFRFWAYATFVFPATDAPGAGSTDGAATTAEREPVGLG